MSTLVTRRPSPSTPPRTRPAAPITTVPASPMRRLRPTAAAVTRAPVLPRGAAEADEEGLHRQRAGDVQEEQVGAEDEGEGAQDVGGEAARDDEAQGEVGQAREGLVGQAPAGRDHEPQARRHRSVVGGEAGMPAAASRAALVLLERRTPPCSPGVALKPLRLDRQPFQS